MRDAQPATDMRTSAPPGPNDDAGYSSGVFLAYHPARELAELISEAETLGYGTAWYGDVVYMRDCYAALAVAATQTETIRLAPGVSVPHIRHPGNIAASIATLDEISRGRAILGLGSGSGGAPELHLSQDRPVRALSEAIDIVRLLLENPNEEVVSYEGEIYSITDSRMRFPLTREGIPIFVATHSPMGLRLAGQKADGIMLANAGTPDAVRSAIKHLNDGAKKAGREPESVSVHVRLESCISDEPTKAVNALRPWVSRRITNSWPRWDYLKDLGIAPSQDLQQAAEARDQAEVNRLLKDEDIEATTLTGSPDQAVEQVVQILSAGAQAVIVRPFEYEGYEVAATIRMFAEEVWPRAMAVVNAQDAN